MDAGNRGCDWLQPLVILLRAASTRSEKVLVKRLVRVHMFRTCVALRVVWTQTAKVVFFKTGYSC